MNVNGLHSKAGNIKNTITTNQLDVIGLSETMHRDNLDSCLAEVTPPHFSLVQYPRISVHGGGLVILYDTRKFINCRLLTIQTGTFYNLSVRVKSTCGQSYNLVSIYRKPGYAGVEFRQELQTVLKKMTKREAILIIGGDFNIRVERLYEASVAKFLEILAEHDLRQYTCCETQDEEGTLDLCILKFFTNVQVTVSTVPYTTDHRLIQFDLPPTTVIHQVRATCAVCPSVCHTPLYLKG